MKIGYYSELDPFSGSIQQRMISLERLLRDLKLLCLLDDVVIVPPGNLVEHGLALPAFEALTPFVRAGKLGTSEDHSAPGPLLYIEERAATYADDHSRRGPKGAPRKPRAGSGEARMRLELDEMKGRWAQILPEQWSLTRDVGQQIAGFTEQLRAFCANTAAVPSAGPRLLRIMNQLADAGHPRMARNALLSQVAGLRGEIPPHELARVTMAVQAAYFNVGADSHQRAAGEGPAQVCRLFPGRFGWILLHNAAYLPHPGVPPYDWKAHPFFVGQRLRRLGIDLEALLRLDANALFEVACSREWQAVREQLTEIELPSEVGLSARALVERYRDFRDALPLLPSRLGDAPRAVETRPAPTLLPAPWQLSAQAILGARVPGKELTPEPPRSEVVLDLRTLLLGDPRWDSLAKLTRSEAYLVTLLSAAGEVGLRVHDIKQLMLELDLLQTSAPTTESPPDSPGARWKAEGRESEARGASLVDRVHVLKTRTNQVLEPFRLAIDAHQHQGRWRLVGLDGGGVVLRVEGVIWDLVDLSRSGKCWSAGGGQARMRLELEEMSGRWAEILPERRSGSSLAISASRARNSPSSSGPSVPTRPPCPPPGLGFSRS